MRSTIWLVFALTAAARRTRIDALREEGPFNGSDGHLMPYRFSGGNVFGSHVCAFAENQPRHPGAGDTEACSRKASESKAGIWR